MKTEIEQFYPCREAVEFRKQFETFKEAWDSCPRGDWMLWIAFKLRVDERKMFLAKGLCAETVEHLMKDDRSVKGFRAAITYGRGEISKEELKRAADVACAASAYYAAYAAACADVSYAAYAAAYAADVSADVSFAAAYAADASADAADVADAADAAFAAAFAAADAADAAYAAYAAADVAYKEAKKTNQKQTADICREVLTEEVMEKINGLNQRK